MLVILMVLFHGMLIRILVGDTLSISPLGSIRGMFGLLLGVDMAPVGRL